MTGDDAWAGLEARVQTWIEDDPDPQTADELRGLLDVARAAPPTIEPGREPDPTQRQALDARTAAREELADRFSGLLQFGTAGLRGRLGGGPHRMNRAVVIRAASGLADYLLGELDGVQPRPRVVIGYDARHKSVDFARDSAAVLTAVGIEVLVLPSALPTPVLAFAVRHLGADAGIMVTASHNPPQDNGYKVYLGGRVVTDSGQGAQIVPPADAAIAAEIAHVPSVASVPRAASGWTVLGPDVLDAYVASVVALAPTDDATRAAAKRLRIVLTPLHGVGGEVAARVLAEAGFTDVLVVPEQAEPDGDFPSVAFPNPEEPGAIDLAIGLASDEGADLVIALDPDADRCGVGIQDLRHRSFRGPDTAEAEGWRILHGDETGSLLGARVAGTAPQNGAAFASSIVSSRLLGKIAAAAGYRHAQTLTGFKWISRVDGLVFGYEEALGYCVDPAHVRDKDGISAALLVAGLAARLKAEGRSVTDALDDLARAHGLHLTDQVSARFADLSQIGETVGRFRSRPPTTLGGARVTEVVDLASGSEDDRDGLPPTEGLRLLTADGTRVIVRPSGTEPKVKCYLEVVLPVDPAADHAALGRARHDARSRLDAVAADVRAALGI
ncbi:phospho-sugar mutase [Cellulomonas terrae]|uniref:Phosphomannomutase n=1 Tax=Cellulomonas terrae TaxID=311234 RepID=A0A511JK06_9CELL|nr:phospho-sugar mutase [Cellulomonas terrae]GEL97983.1 phosphomannomutase [Cellulomonas terrae]